MNNKLYIPKTISVGYQKRGDTYTDALGYVIYTDDKGVLRKEGSWQGWRDQAIPANLFQNEPTDGFILNKGISGGGRGWDSRQSKIRIYDPRGHEIEIPIDNLLFILQEYTSAKGKAIDGKFVYAWQGKDLVLLPTDCLEYKQSVEFSTLQAQKVSARDLVIGATYITKQDTELIYMGRFVHYSSKNNYEYNYSRNARKDVEYKIVGKKKHIFLDPERVNCDYYNDRKFAPLNSMGKLAKLGTEGPIDNYAEMLDEFLATKEASPPVGMKAFKKKFNVKKASSYGGEFYLDIHGVMVSTRLNDVYFDYKNKLGYTLDFDNHYEMKDDNTIIEKDYHGESRTLIPTLKLNKETQEPTSSWGRTETKEYYTKEQLEGLNWYEVKMETESGHNFKIESYKNL